MTCIAQQVAGSPWPRRPRTLARRRVRAGRRRGEASIRALSASPTCCRALRGLRAVPARTVRCTACTCRSSPGTESRRRSWVGLRNYTQALGSGEIRGAFEHAFVLICFYSLLTTAVALAARRHHGRHAGSRARCPADDPVPAVRDRSGGHRCGLALAALAGRSGQRVASAPSDWAGGRGRGWATSPGRCLRSASSAPGCCTAS